MKVFFKDIFQLTDGYQEILIDGDNFKDVQYTQIGPQKQNVNGLVFEDVFVLEPLGYYELVLKENTPHNFTDFYPDSRLLKAGLVVSGVDKKNMSVFIYNTTQNHIFVRPSAVIGEIE